jgi:hypothetical protein
MAITYTVHGPFPIEHEALHDGKKSLKVFWDEAAAEMQWCRGIYVFGIRAGKGITPYYVGKATKSFRQECFQPDKLHKYVSVLSTYSAGTPVIFFLAREGVGKIKASQVAEIESYLISVGWQKNPEIRNIQGVGEPDWRIKGVVRGGKGKPGPAALGFRGMMGL